MSENEITLYIVIFLIGMMCQSYREKRHNKIKRKQYVKMLRNSVYYGLSKDYGLNKEEALLKFVKNAPGIPIGIIAEQLNQFEWLDGEKFKGELKISFNDSYSPYRDIEYYWLKKDSD